MPLEDFRERFSHRFGHLIGRRIVVALSGGPDSVALLHLLRSPDLDLHLEAVHVHHSARGDEADQDASFCRLQCDRLGVPFHLVKLEPQVAPADGYEAAWRQRRYEALLELKDQIDAAAVATGHHLDDVAEGVLMQLLRGAGTRALAGIAAETDDGIIRPLLDWRRSEILDWLREENLGWREDSSNRDLNHLRNRIRHMVLPELRVTSPKIDDHLVALARALARDEDYFADQLRLLASWIEPWSPDGGVPISVIRELASPLRSRWLHAQAERSSIGKVSRRQLELFEAMVEDEVPRAVTLAGRWRLRLARGRLWLEPPVPPASYSLELEVDCGYELPIGDWWVRVRSGDAPDPAASWHRFLADDARLVLRSPAPGDVIADRSDVTKVTKALARALPRHLRSSWPLLCENDTITWIPGIWQASSTGSLLVEVMSHGGPSGRLQR
jgi:tRNA(Ile)-lysidine synthase